MIERLTGTTPTRSRAAAYKDLAFAVATSPAREPSYYEQTRGALARIDNSLRDLGTDKSRILTAIVYIADMSRKEEMNRAWDEWVDAENPPVRACIGVTLEGNDLVEIVVTAVRDG